jgi:hypothetical protein
LQPGFTLHFLTAKWMSLQTFGGAGFFAEKNLAVAIEI